MFSSPLTAYPYASSRKVIMGLQCAAATSQPLATMAGMEMFMSGGNAIDAAIAMAIALTVVEPTSNGIGGDAFAMVWDGKLHGLNASGQSPVALTLDKFKGLDKIPLYGWLSVTVPGAVSAWQALWQRWGKLPFERLFEPAIRYAEQGFPVSPETATAWQKAYDIYAPLVGEEFQAFKHTFFPQGRAPQAGETWNSPNHAQTLRLIANSQGEEFYRGSLATAIAKFAKQTGGLLTEQDLANHQPLWVEPLAIDYRGLTIWELPPNTQGLAALSALKILENYDLASMSTEEAWHVQIEAMKLGFADTHRYVADPNHLEFPVEHLFSHEYARDRRCLISDRAMEIAEPGLPQSGTVYLATADQDFMVSYIQSNYMGFGSGILIPGTGIALQNRATGFSLQAHHPNAVAGGKRPFHTIIPGFLSHGDCPLGPFGVMGGPMQPQGHVQVVNNLWDYRLNPQAALDAPRWQFVTDKQVLLENYKHQPLPASLVEALLARGHQIQLTSTRSLFGRGQIILRQGKTLIAGSDPRSDGLALAM